MDSPALAYPDWKAPAADGQILVWPDAKQIIADTAENHTRLKGEVAAVQNVPLSEVRRQMRAYVGIEDEETALFNGHQTELYHPGVWAKDVLTTAAMEAMVGARSWHLAVDIDQPKHLDLRWPGGSMPFTDDSTRNSLPWTAPVRSPSSEHLKQLQSTFAAAAAEWNFAPAAMEFLSSVEKHLSGRSVIYASGDAIWELDRAIGLKYKPIVAWWLLQSIPYHVLVAHLLARAAKVATAYNAALLRYRRAHKIRTTARPMPDLRITDHECEVPFWLDNLSAIQRHRAFVVLGRDGKWVFQADEDQFVLDPSADGWDVALQFLRFLDARNLRLSPRALTLTMFVRLFLADQFVHGIGGGRYDQVTDALIRTLFGIAPPKFCVTTATLYFPSAVGQQRVCLPCMEHEGHRVRHSLLGEEKRAIVRQMAALPRNSIERRTLFGQLHDRLNAEATENPALRAWQARFDAAKIQHEEEKAIFDRELFFAIQPKERLAELIQRYHDLFARSN